jgi:hypothetical protein
MAGNRCDAPVIFGATGNVARLETFPELAGLVERKCSTKPPPTWTQTPDRRGPPACCKPPKAAPSCSSPNQQLRHADEPYQRMWNSDHEPIR